MAVASTALTRHTRFLNLPCVRAHDDRTVTERLAGTIFFVLAVTGSLLLSSRTGLAVTPTESELADAARWAAAKFKAAAEPPFSFN